MSVLKVQVEFVSRSFSWHFGAVWVIMISWGLKYPDGGRFLRPLIWEKKRFWFIKTQMIFQLHRFCSALPPQSVVERFVHSNLYEWFSLTALVKPVDTGDVILAHLCGPAEVKIRIAPCNDGRLSVFGEGEPWGGNRQQVTLTLVTSSSWDGERGCPTRRYGRSQR